jgi:hypothetical protein
MVRNMEKLLKIECPKRVPKLKAETIEVVPKTFELDLINIEPYIESGIIVHVDLALDQLEDPEE